MWKETRVPALIGRPQTALIHDITQNKDLLNWITVLISMALLKEKGGGRTVCGPQDASTPYIENIS